MPASRRARALRELAVLACFLAAGVVATWPLASYITGRLPAGLDQAQYVWNFWWVARQVMHLSDPWFTGYLAAPVGVSLGYDTLSPLLGLVMMPVTLAFGPSASFTLSAIAAPGLAAYAMYRAARLWLPGLTGPIAAGAFYGLSAMLGSQAWLHLHTAMGCVFLPLALAAAIRLRREPGIGRGAVLGLVVGAAMLVDQESAVLAAVVAVLALLPLLVRTPAGARLRAAAAVAASAVTGLAVAGPQLAAMAAETGRKGPSPPPQSNYVRYAAELPSLFAPSPRLASIGLGSLSSAYSEHTTIEMVATFGVVLSALAILGLIVSWRRPGSVRLALLWLGGAALALGPTLYIGTRQYIPLATAWRGTTVSLLMPYTWLLHIPGLASFREADRLAFIGLVGAAMLAGAAVGWLRQRAWPLVIVVALAAVLEAGWPGLPGQPTMPTALPAVDRPIAADHSGSVVVDVPFVIRGPQHIGSYMTTPDLVLATADGHPRGDSYTSAVPRRTLAGIQAHPFYTELVAVTRHRRVLTSAELAAARSDLRRLHVGWVLVWTRRWVVLGVAHPGRVRVHYAQIRGYLAATGFRLDYQADGVLVYRAVAAQKATG